MSENHLVDSVVIREVKEVYNMQYYNNGDINYLINNFWPEQKLDTSNEATLHFNGYVKFSLTENNKQLQAQLRELRSKM